MKRVSIFKKIEIWWDANLCGAPYYRVDYPDGKRTRLIHKGEAIGLSQIYNGKMYIDYKSVVEKHY